MRIIQETKLDFDDVLIKPSWSPTPSRSAVDIEREYKFYNSSRVWKGFPLMASNMDTVGTFAMADVFRQEKSIVCLHKHYELDKLIEFYSDRIDSYAPYHELSVVNYVWYSLGINDEDINKLKSFLKKTTVRPNLCIDIANGYSELFVKKCAEIREICPNSIILAGNVVTEEMVQILIEYGKVDIVKIGIGPGSACTTRLKTGVGYPQLSAAIECSNKAHGLKSAERRMGLICADGGCKNEADICKAFGAGSDFVMIGGLLAGAEECDGEWEYEYKTPNGFWQSVPPYQRDNIKRKKSLKFYGMSSYDAQDKHNGRSNYKGSEGKVVTVPYKGSVSEIIHEIKAGIRSCCSYVGATCIKDLSKCTTFLKVNRTHNTVFGG